MNDRNFVSRVTSKARDLGNKARDLGNKAAVAGTAMLASGAASAQVDTAPILAEIEAASTAGNLVLGAMILAVLGFAAWKILRRAA